MQVKNKNIFFSLVIVLIIGTILYANSQYLNKDIISAVLLHQLDVNNPPENVFAASISDQKLPDGKNIPRGTKFIGMVSKGDNGITIYFNEIQLSSGEKEQLLAKSQLNIKIEENAQGVSAKIGKTIHEQTKTNVLGAIFNNPSNTQELSSTVLQRGYALKIEVN